MFVDSHCHLEMKDFDKDREEIIEKSVAEDLSYLLTVGTEEKYFKKVINLVDRYPQVYGALGIHPHNAGDYNDRVAGALTAHMHHPKIVALGEIGLDYFRNYSPRDVQVRAFEAQIELAKRLGFPIIIHSRDSKEETLSILKRAFEIGSLSGVIHCFSYDLPTAKQLLDMGFYISIPGTITYTKNTALFDVAKYLPLDRILAETDAPFLTPNPHRGKRNLPYFVKITIERLASLKDMETEELASHIHRNFEALFLGHRVGGKE